MTPETPETAADRAKLVAKIIENSMTLMQNAYGQEKEWAILVFWGETECFSIYYWLAQ